MSNFPIFVSSFTTFLNISTKACSTSTFFTSYLSTIPCRRTLTLNRSSSSRVMLSLETIESLNSCCFRRLIMAYAALKTQKYNCRDSVQILGFHEHKGHSHFDHVHSKIIESTFSFPEFVLACNKSVYSICSFLKYSQFQSLVTRLATPIFDHAHPRIFKQLLIFVNLYQHAKNQLFHQSIQSILEFCD